MKKTLAIVLVLAVMFSMNIGGFHVHAHAEDGWDCPDCGAWARGNECWNCGFTLQPGPVYVESTDDIQGWECPDCGSWCRGDQCWNCGFTLQPGPVYVDSYDVEGWTCPVCGSWARGSECWNCGYVPGGYYYGVVTYPTYATTVVNSGTTTGTTTGTGTVNLPDSSVFGQQITFIASKFNELKQDDSEATWFYTVTDLDHNGLLELVATKALANSNVKLKVWEVNLNGSEMRPCTLPEIPPPEGQSADAVKDSFAVNIHDDVVDTFYDSANNIYYYIFVTVDGVNSVVNGDTTEAVGSGSMATTYAAVSLKDCAMKDGPLAACLSTVNESGQLQIKCRNNKAEDITMDQFVNITDTTFAGMARSNTAFDWFRADEAATLERFSNSYAVFDGRRDINESTIKNNFMQNAAGVYVTRNPTLERHAVGETASFYAYANAYDEVVWSFVSADGKQTYNAAQFMQTYGGTVSGEYTTDLKIAQVNQNMNGCSVYATFSYRGMLARTCHATLYVWQNVPQEYINYNYGIKETRIQTPVSNLGTVYVSTIGYDIQGWTCPVCGVWARGNECWNCGYTLSTPVYEIQGWTCPNCGAWARGDECWSCGYVPGSIQVNDIQGGYCPICGTWMRGDECWNCGYNANTQTIVTEDIQGWTCPLCGSWCRGDECWNCGYNANTQTIVTEDIQGGYCPICGEWMRGDECWNCGYNALTGTISTSDWDYTPNYTGDDGDYGWTPIEQYTDDDGDYGYTPMEMLEDDIYGSYCPICGEWMRGGECWNCGYTAY